MIWSRKSYKWFYDNIHSRAYDWLTKYWFLPFGGETRFRESLISDIVFSPKETILDMCCGTGSVTFVIAKFADIDSRIIGIDLSKGQIEKAIKRNKLTNVVFIEGDVSRTDYEDGKFDKVFISHALHEMTRDSRLKVIREAKRILKENGQVIVLELDNPNNILVRIFIGFWFSYWLPFNFETPTRRDMFKHGLLSEMKASGITELTKVSKYRQVFQVVSGKKKK
jgi:demethylmenaquinone methyltransferase/2-methoxy-6-polyprenyl-1,4-benzoquinol methylase